MIIIAIVITDHAAKGINSLSDIIEILIICKLVNCAGMIVLELV